MTRNKWVRRFAAVVCKSLITLLRRFRAVVVRRFEMSHQPPHPITEIIDKRQVRRWCGGSGVYPPIPPYRSYAPIWGMGPTTSGVWTPCLNHDSFWTHLGPIGSNCFLGEITAMMSGARTQSALTKHKKRTSDGVIPLTPAEITILTVQFPPDKALRLGSGNDIRREMRRIYRGVIDGKLPLSAGTKLVYILDKIAKSATEDEKLEILRKGGISGAPFVGLMIVPPK